MSDSQQDFNPRTHRGVRPLPNPLNPALDNAFQSTHPSWGATKVKLPFVISLVISIHAPIVGCDSAQQMQKLKDKDFNPRTHRGVRR